MKADKSRMMVYTPEGKPVSLAALAREKTVASVRLLGRVVDDSRYDIELRVEAAGRLLALGWAKAADRHVHGLVDVSGPQHSPQVVETLRRYLLEHQAAPQTDQPQACVQGEVVDVQ